VVFQSSDLHVLRVVREGVSVDTKVDLCPRGSRGIAMHV
jgi:hypothetical protein